MTEHDGYPQINNAFKYFLRTLGEVNSFAIDHSSNQHSNNKNSLDYQITTSSFYSDLYIDRTEEEEILELLRVGSKMLVLVGARGSGKTCIGLRIVDKLKSLTDNDFYVDYIDIRTKFLPRYSELVEPTQTELDIEELYDADELKEMQDTLARHLQDKITNGYLNNIFPNLEDERGINRRHELLAFLLSNDNRMPETYEFLTNLQFEAETLFQQYKSLFANRKNANYYQWLNENITSDERVRTLTIELHNHLTTSMVAHAAKILHNYRHQFIWIDNLDFLPEKQQAKLHIVLENFYARIQDFASVIIAVREQNVYKEYELDELGAPPLTTVVKLYTGKTNSVDAIEMSSIEREKIKELISKRLIFARKLHTKEIRRREILIQELAARSASQAATTSEKNSAQKSIDVLTAETKALGPSISDRQFAFVQKVSQNLVEVYERQNVLYFANGSLRQLLTLHTDSLSYFLSRPKYITEETDPKKLAIPAAIDYEYPKMVTMFFMWLRSANYDYDIGAYDIIRNTEIWHSEKRPELGCFLEYMLITSTWNLTIDKPASRDGRYKIPTVREVTNALNKLGYTEDQIFNAIFNLYDLANRNGLIEIQSADTSHIGRIEDMTPENLLSVTPSGKALILNIANTFGYSYECNRLLKENPKQSSKRKWHPTINYSTAFDDLLPSLCDVAQMHIDALLDIRKASVFKGQDWMFDYRKVFGIPINKNIARSGLSEIGKPVGGMKKALQFEVLIAGISQYYPLGNDKDRINMLNNLFSKKILLLESNKEIAESSFREELGLEKRNA